MGAFVALLVLPGCVLLISPPPRPSHPAPFPRQCTPTQTLQSFDCAEYRFDLFVTPNAGRVGVEVSHELGVTIAGDDGSGHLTGASRTECGCIQTLAQKADWAADNNYTATVSAYCHCTLARN
jgi:hypothetical protein